MSLTTPITGITSVAIGSTSQLSNSTGGGSWSSSDITIATVNSSGLVTTVAVGTCYITYTVSSNSISIQFGVTSVLPLTNGFNFNFLYPAISNRVLWFSQGAVSDSQRYYEDGHPLANTSILDAIRPQDNTTLAAYLSNKQRSIIMECINAIFNAPQVIDEAKLCFYRSDVMLYPQPVTNQGQFVGIKMYMSQGDYSVIFNSLELYFNANVSFNMYLYNDMTMPPIAVIPVTAQANQQTIINLKQSVINTYLSPSNKGGIIYFGYYQADLGTAQAVYYPINNQLFHPVKLWAYSSPVTTDSQGNRNFVRNNIGANNLTYGMNLEVCTFVDPTENIISNSHLFDELFILKMAEKCIKDIIFSYRSNGIQRVMSGIPELKQLYAELDGYKIDDEVPYVIGLKSQISREVKRVKDGFQKKVTSLIGVS